jgi:hypothetical protein
MGCTLATVSVKKEFLDDLVDFKLRFITNEINRILAKWNRQSIDKFLKDARTGVLEESEDDAIDLTNLIAQRDELYRLKTGWNSS